MLQEFKNFIMRGNVLDLAVGIILGAAFNKIVASLVDDIIMPPLGMIMGGVDFSNIFISLNGQGYANLASAQAASAPIIRIGQFINTIIQFLIVAFAVFILVKQISRFLPKKVEPPKTKDCAFCKTGIPIQAIRCPNCTSELQPA